MPPKKAAPQKAATTKQAAQKKAVVKATPKGITQKQFDDLQKQLLDAQTKAEELDQNYAELTAEYKEQVEANKRLKSEVTTQKVEKASLKEELANLKTKAHNTVEDIGTGAGKFNDFSKRLTAHKWVAAFLLVLLAAAIVYAVVVSIQKNNIRNDYQRDKKALTDSVNYYRNDRDLWKNKSAISKTDTFPKRDPADEVKKKFRNQQPLTA